MPKKCKSFQTTAAIPGNLVYLLEWTSHVSVSGSEFEDDNFSDTDIESIVSDEFESDVEF